MSRWNSLIFAFVVCQLESVSAASPATPQQATNIQVVHYSGQTFITWNEDPAPGERYRFYRSSNQILDVDDAGVQRIEVAGGAPLDIWENSGEFYADRIWANAACDSAAFLPRFVQRLFVPTTDIACGPDPVPTVGVRPVNSTPLEGLLVLTLHANDGAGGFYAITTVDSGDLEDETCVVGVNSSVTPVPESACDPMPLDVTSFATPLDPEYRVLLQYMDIREWNTTFHAPNSTNCWWGEHPEAVEIRNARQYAYTYVVRDPGASHPPPWPVRIDLHRRMTNRIEISELLPGTNPGPAVLIVPVDVSDTWWFGFAKDYDYRSDMYPDCQSITDPINGCNEFRPDPSIACTNDCPYPTSGTVVNYTQHRVLRMLYDLSRDPLYWQNVDMDRVYAQGHSMGGSGALSFALHFPNVFAATQCSKQMTDFDGYLSDLPSGEWDYSAEMFVRWGDKSHGFNLPVNFMGPNDWAQPLINAYTNTPVWTWLDHEAQMTPRIRDGMSPFGIVTGILDPAIKFSTQGVGVYAAFGASKRAWGGWINCTPHTPQILAGLPPSLTYRYDATAMTSVLAAMPFSDYNVRRSETVPGFSNMTVDPPPGQNGLPCATASNCNGAPAPAEMGKYYHNLMWSSSWNPWDIRNGNFGQLGTPIDKTKKWVISLKFLGCGAATDAYVDVTPRRCQVFVPTDPVTYHWQTQDMAGNYSPLSNVTVGTDGLLTIPGVHVTGPGIRLIITR